MFCDKQSLWRLSSEVIGYLTDASGCVLMFERDLIYRRRQGGLVRAFTFDQQQIHLDSQGCHFVDQQRKTSLHPTLAGERYQYGDFVLVCHET